MLSDACLHFREDFEPGQQEGHAAICPSCKAWAREVQRLWDFGADLPLPPSQRLRLMAISDHEAEAITSPTLGPLPQAPVPADLMARLYRIPSQSRFAEQRSPAFSKSSEMIAASFLFATLLTLGLGHSLVPVDGPDLGAASRLAGAVMKGASSRGTRTLLGAGDTILEGCINANRSLERLLERIGEPRRVSSAAPQTTKEGREHPPQPRSSHGKENPHGSR